MDIKEIAARLNGREYINELTRAEESELKNLGYVVVFGYSDDCAELRGAIDEEVGCYDGGEILLDKDGILEECEDACKYYRKAIENAKVIEIVWDEEGYTWICKTDIPHETFDIFEDDTKYCRGIVFDIKSLDNKPNLESIDNLPLTIDDLLQMDNEPVWTDKRCGVVRAKPDNLSKRPAIHFNYGWEWADDVLACGSVYRNKPSNK